MPYLDSQRLRPILDEEVSDVNVPGSRSGGHASVRLQLDGTFVVLFEPVLGHGVPLCLQEHLHPHRVREVVARANQLRLGGALRV